MYHGDLLKAPDLMEGYQGRDEHFDSDVELLGASSDSSIRSIPLGLSKGGGRGKKDAKKRINRDADTAIPAAVPMPGVSDGANRSASAAVPAADHTIGVSGGVGGRGVPAVAGNRVVSGSKFLPMTGTVAYCLGDRGYIKPDQGGEDFFFWTNGSGIKWGDNVKFQYDPNEKKRLTRHRRKAFSISVVRVMDRQGTAVPRGDSRGVINQQRPVADAYSMRDERQFPRMPNHNGPNRQWGPAVAQLPVGIEVATILRQLASDSADMKLRMEMMERRQSGSLGDSN